MRASVACGWVLLRKSLTIFLSLRFTFCCVHLL
jgi:hypothetical protein